MQDQSKLAATYTFPDGCVHMQTNWTPHQSVVRYLQNYMTTDSHYEVPDEVFSRMPHEILFEHIFPQEKSDVRLTTIFRLDEPSDYLTPDLIRKTENEIEVIELKTCYFNDMMKSRSQEVIDLYNEEVKKRAILSKLSYSLYYIVVSRDRVLTNYPKDLPKDLNELYVECSNLKSLATQSGWLYEMDNGFSEDQKQLLSDLKQLHLPKTAKGLEISLEDIENWQSRPERVVKASARSQFLGSTGEAHREVLNSMRATKDPEKIIKDYDERCVKQISKYWKAHDGHYNSSRTDKKACIQLPLFVAKLDLNEFSNHDRLSSLLRLRINPTRAHSRLWLASLEWASQNFDDAFADLVILPDLEPTSEKSDIQKKRRRKHFRVKPTISEDDKVKLATVGIESRKFRDDSIVQSLIDEKSKGFSSSVDVSDIDRFVKSFKVKELEWDFSPLFSDLETLHSRALEIMNQGSTYNKFTDDSTGFVDRFSRSNLGVALEQLDYIVQEVNISRQQYCNSGEFILKSLPMLGIHLLIKPTNPNSQIFFSVLVKKEDMIEKFDLPFKTMHDFGDVYISEFVSLNPHSCTHYLYVREKAMSLFAMWMSLHSTYLTAEFEDIPEDCHEHFNASLLFWLEGKEQTSKEVQQVRYAYMEVCMDNFINHNPLKILSKWEEFSRSRLCIWMRKRVINCLANMKPGKRYTSLDEFDITEFDKTLDKDCAVISWVTGKEVGKFEIALNLSYFGVLHNKEDSKEMHGYLKIFQKVISEELKMRDAKKENMGRTSNNPADLRSHEFNTDFVCAIGDTLARKLEERHPGHKSWILNKCTEKLLGRDIEKLATMKKSATGDLSRFEHIRDSKENERVTCLEASIHLMEKGMDYRVMKQVGTLAKQVQRDYGGIVSNLFKKLQIGGVREIFVLEFRCRIVVHFVESICRTICDEMDNEMLTKGDKKLNRTDQHFQQMMSHLKPSRTSATVINSDDATTWAQRFVMPVFGCFLSRLLPDEFIEPVMFVLNMVTNKKLELPHQLLDLYDMHPEVKGFDEGMNELKDQYMGLSNHSDLLEPRSRMLKNQSNMMQGILHYTSSLLHSGFLYMWEEMSVSSLRSVLSKTYSLSSREMRIISTTKVSSDDSSCILSVVVEKEPADATEKQSSQLNSQNLRMLMSVFTEAKAKLYPLFAAKQSVEKSSTSGHSNVEEFNSLWYYKNTLITPSIKFVAACVKTHPNSKLDDRYNTYANLRNNLFEHSGNIMLCNVCQFGQLSAHYKTLGLRTNRMWEKYRQTLLESPHPAIGFFLLEHPLCCGMFGTDMSVYMACSNPHFRNMHLGLYKDENFEFTEDGKPTVRTYISFGQSAKYYAFKQALRINDSELRSYVEENLINLYRETSTTYDSLMKLKIQASNPALSESMSFQTDSRLHAASSYILQDAVILQSKGMMGASHTHKTFFGIANSLNTETIRDYKWLFPFGNFYDSVLSVLNNYKTSSLGAYINRRSVASKLDISTNSVVQSVTLFQVLQRLWFDIPDVKGTRFSHNLVLNHYKQKFPWICDTAEETLTLSPFNDHMSLRNFIISVSAKKKTVRTYAPSNVVSSPIDIVRSMVENCQWKGQKLNYVAVNTVDDARTAMQILTERIWRCLRAPLVHNKAEKIEEILAMNIDPFASAELTKDMYELSQSQIALSVMIKYAKMADQSSVLKSVIPALIERFRLGVIGYFSVRQTLHQGLYKGKAVYTGLMEGFRVEILAQDSIVQKISCVNEVELSHMSHTLWDFIKDLGWTVLHPIRRHDSKYWDFNVRRMVRTKHVRSVEVEFTKLKGLPELSTAGMKLEVTDYNTIRLVNYDLGRKYTILSYRVKTRDLGSNDTHKKSDTDDNNDHVSTWLRSDRMQVRKIEDEILSNPDYESWTCDTLRRRLMGLNKLPNLDSLFEQSADQIVTNDDSDSDTSSFMRMAAQEMMTPEDLEMFEFMFRDASEASDDESEATSEDHQRLALEEFTDASLKDLSWLDYVKMPFKPGISVDSAVTNKFFDDFIDEYSTIFGKVFLNFFVRKPLSLRFLIETKRKREAENDEMFSSSNFDDVV
jgi:hypothetical protein